MKVVLLAGGLGTRLAEETSVRPKPMVEIGGRPILWHIMKGYAHHGISEFIVALGYRGDVIKEWFLRHNELMNDLTVDLAKGVTTVHSSRQPGWRVHLVDTGAEGWVNGGFFVFEPAIFDRIEGDHEPLERGPMERLTRGGELMAFLHRGFWQPMDTLREKQELERLWATGRAPWKVWES